MQEVVEQFTTFEERKTTSSKALFTFHQNPKIQGAL